MVLGPNLLRNCESIYASPYPFLVAGQFITRVSSVGEIIRAADEYLCPLRVWVAVWTSDSKLGTGVLRIAVGNVVAQRRAGHFHTCRIDDIVVDHILQVLNTL